MMTSLSGTTLQQRDAAGLQKLSNVQSAVLALITGALLPLSLSPLDVWPLAFISTALLPLLLLGRDTRSTLIISYCFGFGLYGVGASWVFVSIYEFGHTPLWLALLMTSLFVAFLALVFCLPFYLLNHPKLCAKSERNLWFYLFSFAALWVLGEWFRSWFLTGFPWLFIGYSQLTTPLSGWAPSFGIFAVSLAVLLSAVSLSAVFVSPRKQHKVLALALIVSLWLGGWSLGQQHWTQVTGERRVALVQANIPQELKWQPQFLQTTLERYRELSADQWSANDWVIWPEAAIPLLYHRAKPFLNEMTKVAEDSDSALITGILYDSPIERKVYNSIVGLGEAQGIYLKTRLVPFGEYVPLENLLRGMIEFFNLPTSIISAGKPDQRGLIVNGDAIAAAICYEIVYPDLVAQLAQSRGAIITISNDAWFGRSWGPLQHLQMAQMRALETGRYVIRATNNGVSAIIAADGSVQKSSDQFVQQVISERIQMMSGSTPFMRWGSYPIIVLCMLLLAFISWRSRNH